MPKMQQNTIRGRAPPGPAEGARGVGTGGAGSADAPQLLGRGSNAPRKFVDVTN